MSVNNEEQPCATVTERAELTTWMRQAEHARTDQQDMILLSELRIRKPLDR